MEMGRDDLYYLWICLRPTLFLLLRALLLLRTGMRAASSIYDY